MSTASRNACSLVTTTPDTSGWLPCHRWAAVGLVKKFITPQQRSAATAQAPSAGQRASPAVTAIVFEPTNTTAEAGSHVECPSWTIT